eukprot:TRINITY_DN66676_c6_g8_i1.p1 TRINITY_DN66676_c6_g8~~TRINITY_DN66676_c6_g8_i1.p1  ORF type:complete len:615 (+),score=308.97 TRINITY_DN66676_c6_g8_i1:217-1845(+)
MREHEQRRMQQLLRVNDPGTIVRMAENRAANTGDEAAVDGIAGRAQKKEKADVAKSIAVFLQYLSGKEMCRCAVVSWDWYRAVNDFAHEHWRRLYLRWFRIAPPGVGRREWKSLYAMSVKLAQRRHLHLSQMGIRQGDAVLWANEEAMYPLCAALPRIVLPHAFVKQVQAGFQELADSGLRRRGGAGAVVRSSPSAIIRATGGGWANSAATGRLSKWMWQQSPHGLQKIHSPAKRRRQQEQVRQDRAVTAAMAATSILRTSPSRTAHAMRRASMSQPMAASVPRPLSPSLMLSNRLKVMVRLYNSHLLRPMVYRVRTSNAQLFKIRPYEGVIDAAGGHVVIAITLDLGPNRAVRAEEINRARFTVESFHTNNASLIRSSSSSSSSSSNFNSRSHSSSMVDDLLIVQTDPNISVDGGGNDESQDDGGVDESWLEATSDADARLKRAHKIWTRYGAAMQKLKQQQQQQQQQPKRKQPRSQSSAGIRVAKRAIESYDRDNEQLMRMSQRASSSSLFDQTSTIFNTPVPERPLPVVETSVFKIVIC